MAKILGWCPHLWGCPHVANSGSTTATFLHSINGFESLGKQVNCLQCFHISWKRLSIKPVSQSTLIIYSKISIFLSFSSKKKIHYRQSLKLYVSFTELRGRKPTPRLLLGMRPILTFDLCLLSLLSHKGHLCQKLSHPVTVTSTPTSFTKKKKVKYLSINVMTSDIIRIIRT